MELNRVMDNVYWMGNDRRTLVSLNLVKDQSVYGERLIDVKGVQYREWIPFRSKLAAAIYKGVRGINLHSGSKVLYLGASSGTTVSHVSDIIGHSGQVYAVEIAEEMGIHLILLAKTRDNLFPIIADASRISEYKDIVPKCDFVYQDIAQKDQIGIFIENANFFLKRGGFGAIAIKSRSIDVKEPPYKVIATARSQLQKRFAIINSVPLFPFQKDHELIFIRNG